MWGSWEAPPHAMPFAQRAQTFSGGVEMAQYRTRVPAVCAGCGEPFEAIESELKRGKGKTCSRSCAASLASPKDQMGERNPNWRGGAEPYRDAKRRYRSRHRHKARAHMLVRDAVAAGLLMRSPCEICGHFEVQGHHDDYEKPLDVRWLCKAHHEAHHIARRAAGLEKYAQRQSRISARPAEHHPI